jgi:hypothetical protein
MSDFDFDEIDKAVNNALSGNSELSQSRPDDTLPTPQLVSEPKLQVPAIRRSTGKVMDIVHPTVSPRTPPVSVPSQPVDTPSVPPVTPEPIIPENSDLESSLIIEPLESPFIANAKVEKRPLGGEAPTAAEFDSEELLEAPDEPRIEAHSMPDPIDFAATTNLSPELEAETPPAIELPTPKPQAAELRVNTFEPPSETISTPVAITQQYQEKTSPTAETGAIFDTENYHQPLAHIPKRRSSFWTVFWILLLVVLGGAIGAAAYYFIVQPTL